MLLTKIQSSMFGTLLRVQCPIFNTVTLKKRKKHSRNLLMAKYSNIKSDILFCGGYSNPRKPSPVWIYFTISSCHSPFKLLLYWKPFEIKRADNRGRDISHQHPIMDGHLYDKFISQFQVFASNNNPIIRLYFFCR